MQRFGEKLRFLREKHGMTMRELAEKLGFAAHSYINGLETGKRKPNANVIIKVARLFHVTTDQLLRDDLEVE
jgi:transcriptional regulator with XRE-family HTH domain